MQCNLGGFNLAILLFPICKVETVVFFLKYATGEL